MIWLKHYSFWNYTTITHSDFKEFSCKTIFACNLSFYTELWDLLNLSKILMIMTWFKFNLSQKQRFSVRCTWYKTNWKVVYISFVSFSGGLDIQDGNCNSTFVCNGGELMNAKIKKKMFSHIMAMYTFNSITWYWCSMCTIQRPSFDFDRGL